VNNRRKRQTNFFSLGTELERKEFLTATIYSSKKEPSEEENEEISITY